MENTVASILSEIGVNMQSKGIETCYQSGQTERNTKSKTIIIRFVNRKHCKKTLLNNEKLSNVDNNKLNFNADTNLYINENLTPMNRVHLLLTAGS